MRFLRFAVIATSIGLILALPFLKPSATATPTVGVIVELRGDPAAVYAAKAKRLVGTDNILSAGELSGARTLKFNNPNNETFTVTFNVIGNLANPGNGSSS